MPSLSPEEPTTGKPWVDAAGVPWAHVVDTIACDIVSARRELREILSSGTRTSARELLSALQRDGFVVTRTSKSTHYLVTGRGVRLVIALSHGDVLPVYLSLIRRALREVDDDG